MPYLSAAYVFEPFEKCPLSTVAERACTARREINKQSAAQLHKRDEFVLTWRICSISSAVSDHFAIGKSSSGGRNSHSFSSKSSSTSSNSGSKMAWAPGSAPGGPPVTDQPMYPPGQGYPYPPDQGILSIHILTWNHEMVMICGYDFWQWSFKTMALFPFY